MKATEAISKMIPPSARRNKRNGGVMQIHLTRACDKACTNCTQGSNLRGPYTFMSPSQFDKACASLKGYPFTIGIFGGNPAIHPALDEICGILLNHFPQSQCGIWCNHPLGKGKLLAKTFNPARSNLNCHLDKEAYQEFKRDWPKSNPFGQTSDSRHSPVFGNAQSFSDLTDAEMWEAISNCTINKHWSAGIGLFRDEVRGWFCEIAMAQSIISQQLEGYPDTGMDVEKDHYIERNYPGQKTPGTLGPFKWWQLPIKAYQGQVEKHCPMCLVPLQGYGALACASDEEGCEVTTKEYREVYKPKRRGRQIQFVELRSDLESKNLPFIDYLGGAKK